MAEYIPIATAVAKVVSMIYSYFKTRKSEKLRKAEQEKSEADQKRLLEELRKEHQETEKA